MWFYISDGQQQGPFSEKQFNELIATGRITLDTQVWKEGQSSWQPLRQVRNEFSAGDACQVCGRLVGADHLIELGGAQVCDTCKPVAMQRMREGVPVLPPESRRRPVMVWVISLFYFICTPLGILSLIFVGWLGSSGLPMSPTQRHYFQSQTIFDHVLVAVAMTFSLFGAIQLFRLRAQAFLLFGINQLIMIFNFGYQIIFKNWLGVMAAQPGGYIFAGISMAFSFGIYFAILWYVWHLKNKQVLR